MHSVPVPYYNYGASGRGSQRPKCSSCTTFSWQLVELPCLQDSASVPQDKNHLRLEHWRLDHLETSVRNGLPPLSNIDTWAGDCTSTTQNTAAVAGCLAAQLLERLCWQHLAATLAPHHQKQHDDDHHPRRKNQHHQANTSALLWGIPSLKLPVALRCLTKHATGGCG